MTIPYLHHINRILRIHRQAYLFILLVTWALILLLASCSSEDEDEFTLNGTNIDMADIAGNWNATQGIFDKSAAGPVMQVDVVADGGSITLNIEGNGRFTLTVTPQGEPSEVITGQLGFDEDLLVIVFDSDPDDFEFFSISHNEPVLTIAGGNGSAEYDFDGDGIDEEANVNFVFERI